jgi:hypothetical protein
MCQPRPMVIFILDVSQRRATPPVVKSLGAASPRPFSQGRIPGCRFIETMWPRHRRPRRPDSYLGENTLPSSQAIMRYIICLLFFSSIIV